MKKERKFRCKCGSGNLTRTDQSKYPWIQEYLCNECGKKFPINSFSDTDI